MTIGTIYNISELVPNSFNDINNSNLTVFNGSGNYGVIVNSNSVTLSGIANLILRPTLYHSFDNFSMNVKVNIYSTDYEFEFGLFGQQVNWPINRLFSVKKVGNTTRVENHFYTGGPVLFGKTLPVVFSGDLEIKLTYSNLTWKVALINQGKVHHVYYKYDREIGQGSTTAKFLFTNIVETIDIKRLEIKANCPKNSIVFIGDSITYGATIPFGTGGTFAEQYSKANGNTTVFASSAAGSADIINSLSSLALIEPSKVFILIGDNDNYNDTIGYINRIETIHGTLINLPNPPIVYILNCTPEIADEGYWELNQALNNLASSGNYNIINVWDTLARSDNPKLIQPQYVTDHVHLSQLGHNTIYQLIQNY